MARLPDPLSTLSPDARRVYDKITAKRGQMKGGPFASLMHHPALAEKVGDLGEYLRFGGTLPGDVREMAILITARSVNQAYEWVAHARIARTEKLPDDVIERVVQHVLAYESIPQDLQDQVKADLGMPGLMELVTLAGQYRLIAGVLFAFDSPLPEGTPPPF
jgi:4-carboxymuconolactone decarboxylase